MKMNKKNIDKNKETTQYVIDRLAAMGWLSRPSGLKKHIHQGYMSHVYKLPSSSGNLIINIAKPTKQHILHKTWEKLQAISLLMREKTNLPVSEMILAERTKNNFFTVQLELPGKTAGKRSITGYVVVDKWFRNKKYLINEVQKIMAEIHKIRLAGFGWPVVKNGKLRGKHGTWPEFFREETEYWLKSLKQVEKRRNYARNLSDDTASYSKKISRLIPESPACLIHGDLANPSNLLVRNNEITGVLDWEWSIIGDPAWEFCDPGWEKNINDIGLEPYFRARNLKKEERARFLRNIVLFRPLWCLFETHVHADDEDPLISDTLHVLLEDSLAKANLIIS